MANCKRTCECGICIKCYKREWARKKRQDPEYRAKELQVVKRYQQTDKGKSAKAKADKKFRQTHKEWSTEYKRKRYHALSDEEKAIRNRRYNWRRRYGVDPIQLDEQCAFCGSIENLSLDHKHPVKRGGTSDPYNLQTLCMSCNSFKKDRLVTEGNYPGIML